MIITHLLSDLKTRKAELAEQPQPIYIDVQGNQLTVNNQTLICNDNLECYQASLDLLSQVHNHYLNIVADNIFQALNVRTNQFTSIDIIFTQPVMIRSWSSMYTGELVEAVQLAGEKMRMFAFGVGEQFLVAVQLAKQSWEFYCNQQHCSNVSLFPYVMDKFLLGKISDSSITEKLYPILSKSFPDWHPLSKQV